MGRNKMLEQREPDWYDLHSGIAAGVSQHGPKWTRGVLLVPATATLFVWMIVPLAMTLYYSLLHYNLMAADQKRFVGLQNYLYLFEDPSFLTSIWNTFVLIGSVLIVTVVGGVLMALLYDLEFPGRSIARLMVIAPFFVMPTVNALMWKNMMFNPVYGLIAAVMKAIGLTPWDWLGRRAMGAIIVMVAWQWLPFAFLVLLTAMQSLDKEQKEAAIVDNASPLQLFRYVILPHLKRAISVVIMIEAIFLLAIFAEIYTTTGGGPGTATTNLTFLIYSQGLLQFDIGLASAGGIVAVVLANVVAFLLMRTVLKDLQGSRR